VDFEWIELVKSRIEEKGLFGMFRVLEKSW